MYSLLVFDIQAQISKEFKGVNEGLLARMLDLLGQARNVCAHSERLYDFTAKRVELDNTEMHHLLQVGTSRDGRYKKGKQDLFSLVICFKYLLSEDDFKMFAGSLSSEIASLVGHRRNINKSQIYSKMGLFEGWEAIIDL